MGNMQSKDKINTYLPGDARWVAFGPSPDTWICSDGMELLAASLSMQTATLMPLLRKAGRGRWPVQIGGKLFVTSSIAPEEGTRIITLEESEPCRTAELLEEATGESNFLLCAGDGRIISLSREAASLFGNPGRLGEIFDSSSSGAIHAAVQRCLQEGSVQEFLVSLTAQEGQKTNYGITIRLLPSPGKLLFCRLQIPSVAVVSGTMDRNSQIRTLLEESFCPSITIDSDGVMTSMNQEARSFAARMWGHDPTGSVFFDYIHPDRREAVVNRHKQRTRGFAVPSRYSIQFTDGTDGTTAGSEVSVVPLLGLSQWVVFLRPLPGPGQPGAEIGPEEGLPPGLLKLLPKETASPEEILLELTGYLEAEACAFIMESRMVTVGDSASLISSLNRDELAAAPTGFMKNGSFHRRISSGFGVSHLVIHRRDRPGLDPGEEAAVETASGMLGAYLIRTILAGERKLISVTMDIASAYLRKTESLEGLLFDFARISAMETAAIYRISDSGDSLKGIAGAGTVGGMPDLPLDALTTASWACLRGETAFYIDAPENDLRFSRVFPESLSEIAVPFFRGASPEGVILLASSEREYLASSKGVFIQLLALLFSYPENPSRDTAGDEAAPGHSPVKDQALENLIHNIAGLESACSSRAAFLKRDAVSDQGLSADTEALLQTVSRLGFHGRWALWFLRISMYGGRPDQKWIDPSPLLEKALDEFRVLEGSQTMKLAFIPPPSDIEVCTDGSFVSMIAHSLLVCILENSSNCCEIELSVDSRGDYWTFTIDSKGDSVPADCLSTQRPPDGKNMPFVLGWKLTEELGGTISTFSSQGRSTRMVVRLRTSG